jgi:hypothetical protein
MIDTRAHLAIFERLVAVSAGGGSAARLVAVA